MNDASYVRGLPDGLREFYERHYKGNADSEALACTRLVTAYSMDEVEVYPALEKWLGDADELRRWFQIAAAPLVAINANLRESRKQAMALATALHDASCQFNGLLAQANATPDFWPSGLDLGSLLEAAIDDRGSPICLAPHGQETPFLRAQEMKDTLGRLQVGDDRYFPTLAEVMNQVAIRLDTALTNGEMQVTGLPSIDAGLHSRKANRVATYVRMFCRSWDEAARAGSVPSERPSHAVLRAQTIAVLDLAQPDAEALTVEAIEQIIFDTK